MFQLSFLGVPYTPVEPDLAITESCSVCLEGHSLSAMSVPLGCGHFFHPPCLIPNIANERDNQCPVCRRQITNLLEGGAAARERETKASIAGPQTS